MERIALDEKHWAQTLGPNTHLIGFSDDDGDGSSSFIMIKTEEMIGHDGGHDSSNVGWSLYHGDDDNGGSGGSDDADGDNFMQEKNYYFYSPKKAMKVLLQNLTWVNPCLTSIQRYKLTFEVPLLGLPTCGQAFSFSSHCLSPSQFLLNAGSLSNETGGICSPE